MGLFCSKMSKVNENRYRAMLKKFLFTKIEEEYICNIWIQDGEAKLDVLRPVFEDRISSRADVLWPPRSCDLTPLDYYLWDAVRDKYYADKPETIDALMTIFVKPLVEYSCTQSIMCLKNGSIV